AHYGAKVAAVDLTKSKESADKFLPDARAIFARGESPLESLGARGRGGMRRLALTLLLMPLALGSTGAVADYRITRDHGGVVDEYKARYATIRDRRERVVIDGICNSACTLVLGIVPLNRICVTPRASLGFHMAYYDKATTFGVKVTS